MTYGVGAIEGQATAAALGALPVLEAGVAAPGQAAFACVVRDFANLVRVGVPDPFTPDMAVMSMTMELAAALSARREGARVTFADPEIEQLDAELLAGVRAQFGFDPLDIEAVVAHAFPKP